MCIARIAWRSPMYESEREMLGKVHIVPVARFCLPDPSTRTKLPPTKKPSRTRALNHVVSRPKTAERMLPRAPVCAHEPKQHIERQQICACANCRLVPSPLDYAAPIWFSRDWMDRMLSGARRHGSPLNFFHLVSAFISIAASLAC